MYHYFNPDSAITYTFHSKKLVEILIKYENKSVHSSKGVSNGMIVENINNNFIGIPVIHSDSEDKSEQTDLLMGDQVIMSLIIQELLIIK
ncbi:hypothetical protein F3J02_07840 [Acinetobacter sp. Tr-809]|nr:hypothetical protein [Acinetobacter sp. Tr-809]